MNQFISEKNASITWPINYVPRNGRNMLVRIDIVLHLVFQVSIKLWSANKTLMFSSDYQIFNVYVSSQWKQLLLVSHNLKNFLTAKLFFVLQVVNVALYRKFNEIFKVN